MFKEIKFNSFANEKGSLLPIEFKDVIPFDVKRTYFCYENIPVRGSHCHLKEEEVFILLHGKAKVRLHDGKTETIIELTPFENGVYVANMIWHEIIDMSEDSILLAFSSTNYNPNREDYIEDFSKFLDIVNL
ncbi:FdtA/QdtA family cupin domain-containing protein [bacterium]|jgi:dTDP-4-dehydrorhamnose 3,5-epimerase-like enzyme|nr:FdtA/QdtA family cupin domain-containing protein [bacterium]MBT6293825.1 FdtA/QdtA family cupin domain-containing protein [bacterium]